MWMVDDNQVVHKVRVFHSPFIYYISTGYSCVCQGVESLEKSKSTGAKSGG